MNGNIYGCLSVYMQYVCREILQSHATGGQQHSTAAADLQNSTMDWNSFFHVNSSSSGFATFCLNCRRMKRLPRGPKTSDDITPRNDTRTSGYCIAGCTATCTRCQDAWTQPASTNSAQSDSPTYPSHGSTIAKYKRHMLEACNVLPDACNIVASTSRSCFNGASGA